MEVQAGIDRVDLQGVDVVSDGALQDEQPMLFVLRHAHDSHFRDHFPREVGNKRFLLGRQSQVASPILYPPVYRKMQWDNFTIVPLK